jgi:hypothetical protein
MLFTTSHYGKINGIVYYNKYKVCLEQVLQAFKKDWRAKKCPQALGWAMLL